MNKYLITAFYHFVDNNNHQNLQKLILKFCLENEIKGTILLAFEGINGTISGTEKSIHKFHNFIKNDPVFDSRFEFLDHKESWSSHNPFNRMKVRLKKEIVALGVKGISPIKKVGKYVAPNEWNELIIDPNTVVIDTRNNYEFEIGTFKHAINPNTGSFREFPDFVDKKLNPKKHKKIAMFCTGGIRCEKSTSLLLEKGFSEVYHLKGGILNYLKKIPKKQSLWDGECFVFDQRVAVAHGLSEGKYNQCYACRHPLSEAELTSHEYIKGVSCPYCINKLSKKKKAGVIERQKQITLAETRGERHIGNNNLLTKEKHA